MWNYYLCSCMTTKPHHPPQLPALPSAEKAILLALRQGGRNRGELSDLTGQPYSLLVPTLDALLTRGFIESYFDLNETFPVLTYRLRSPQNTAVKTPPPPSHPPLRISQARS